MNRRFQFSVVAGSTCVVALLLFGAARVVYAEISFREDRAAADDDFFVVLQHDEDVVSHLWGSWVQGAPGPRFRVTGTAGTSLAGILGLRTLTMTPGQAPAATGDGGT